ncbi:MAG TPA: ferritin-like domain-containing protein [Solirubrobacteraceae bacterium]|nr:ferritin-like domain-containing protein [Solirubrobacteraceae bacterium]
MDIDSFLRDAQSRRRFFRRSGVIVGAAGGSAIFLSACGNEKTTTPNVLTGPDESDQADVEILNGALDLELMAVAAYKTGAGRLRGSVLEIGKKFLAQEQEHADGLAAAIKDAGGTPNRAKSSYDFPELRTQTDVLRFAVDLEYTAIAAYIDALPKLSQGDLRATAAGIITNEAEHAAVLLDALGQDPAPSAFVTGVS